MLPLFLLDAQQLLLKAQLFTSVVVPIISLTTISMWKWRLIKSLDPFEGVLEFASQEHSNKLILELRKNNPNDRAKFDDGIEFVVFFCIKHDSDCIRKIICCQMIF